MFNLNGMDMQMQVVLNVQHQIFARGIVHSKGCFVDTTLEEGAFFGIGGDRVIVNVNKVYGNALDGSSVGGNYDTDPNNDA